MKEQAGVKTIFVPGRTRWGVRGRCTRAQEGWLASGMTRTVEVNLAKSIVIETGKGMGSGQSGAADQEARNCDGVEVVVDCDIPGIDDCISAVSTSSVTITRRKNRMGSSSVLGGLGTNWRQLDPPGCYVFRQ